MPRLVNIKDTKFNRYIVAGDVFDGCVYHQADKARPNAVWAIFDVEDTEYARSVQAKGWSLVRFVDLRHGKHLANGQGLTLANGQVVDVVDTAVIETPPDTRALWVMTNDVTTWLKNGDKYLWTDGSNAGLWLGSTSETWQLETTSDGHFTVPRLSFTPTINYRIELDTSPALLPNASIVATIDSALGKWAYAFERIGKHVSVQRDGSPVHITFRWGQPEDPGHAGSTPSGRSAGGMRDRQEPVVVTFNADLAWYAVRAEFVLGFFGPALWQYDLMSVATHELGHVFGLEHCSDPTSAMRAELPLHAVWVHYADAICGFDVLRLRARYIDQF